MNRHITQIIDDEDSVLHSIYWMAEEAGMTLPPIPVPYLDRFIEFSEGSCFSTDESLVSSLGQSNLDRALASGRWPVTGMAFKLVPVGRWLHWQFLLVGRVHLIEMNLMVGLQTDDKVLRLGPISTANDQLERYLADEVALSRYLGAGQIEPGEIARIVRLENISGLPTESHVTWTPNEGLGAPRKEAVIFTYGGASSLSDHQAMIIYP